MAFKYKIERRVPYSLQKVVQSGSIISTRVASGAGVIAFNTSSSSPVTASKYTSYTLLQPNNRHAALISPVPGETFIAPADLRFTASGFDLSRFGGPAGSDHAARQVDFYLNDTKVLTVFDSDNYEFNVFKGRATGIAAGTYQVWCRAIYTDFSYNDSKPFQITVLTVPSYGSIVNLSSDINWSSGISFIGSAGSRIRINGNGFRWIGNPTSFNCQYVDFFNFGATSGFSSINGIDINTSGGNTILSNCRLFNCTPINIVNDGTSLVTVSTNLFSSNSRVPEGQTPDFSGGEAHGSFPCAQFGGNSVGSKTFETNNIGAGWISFSTQNWTIGGPTPAKSNILMGPRVGLLGTGSFTAEIELNYSHHIYYGGWSQGNNFEFWDTFPTIEHNVIISGSWPNRGIDGTFKYNLVLGLFFEEGLIWTHTSAADIHHNIFRVASPASGRGLSFNIYPSLGATLRNNLFDGVNQLGESAVYATNGIYTYNSNLFANNFDPVFRILGGTLTTDYNGFFNAAGAHYSDSRTPTHDVTGSPGFLGAPEDLPFDLQAVWERTLLVTTILATYRGYYILTTTTFDNGDTAVYGAQNPIGPICRAGRVNAFDLFGTL